MIDQSAFVYRVAVLTLALVLLSVVAALLIGLFHDKVDNKEIFTILGPAFQTIVGAFVGLICGIELGKKRRP